MSENKNRAQKTSYLYLILITAIVIVIIAIFAYIAVIMLNSDDEKDETPEYVSSTIISQTDTVISFEDDEEVSSEVSSEEYTDSSHPKLQGTWQKTNVYESKKATLTINRQDNQSFDFTLKIWSGANTAEISGTANYTGENTAVFKKDTASITFDCGSKYLSVYHTGQNSVFGLSSAFTIDGKFTQGTPNYYKNENTNNYDYNTYKSAAVVKSLKSTLSADDYSLYTELMETGLMSPIAYERTVDKNGKNVNVDAEMKCVKYYASDKNIGMNMIMICSNSGKIYVLFYDASEMSYYTNDKNYSSKMPQSFQTVADSKGMKPTYK